MQPKEVAMRMLVKKGLAGDRRALVRVLDQFAAHSALPVAALRPSGRPSWHEPTPGAGQLRQSETSCS